MASIRGVIGILVCLFLAGTCTADVAWQRSVVDLSGAATHFVSPSPQTNTQLRRAFDELVTRTIQQRLLKTWAPCHSTSHVAVSGSGPDAAFGAQCTQSGDCNASAFVTVVVQPNATAFLTTLDTLASGPAPPPCLSSPLPHHLVAVHPEGFVVCTVRRAGTFHVVVVATSRLGVTMALGQWMSHVIPETRAYRHQMAQSRFMEQSQVLAPASLCLTHAPPKWFHTRGHQFTDYGFAFTPWPTAATTYVKDLIMLGTNQVELAHIDWARGDLAKMVTYSALAETLAINISVWYPINLYTASPTAAAQTEKMFASMSRFNSLFVPGGDGGEVLAPVTFLQAVQNLTSVMRRYHPTASVWVSAQDYSLANLTAFMNAVARPAVRSWLTGVVYGPHVHVPLTEFLDMVPSGVHVRQYPDLCHTTQSQFEQPEWDPAFTLTYRRLPISPSLSRYHNIVTLRTNETYVGHWETNTGGQLIGFGAYSEGVSDDLNKAVWSLFGAQGLGATASLAQYARLFFDAPVVSFVIKGLAMLENNWKGPMHDNYGAIARTLSVWRDAYEQASSTEQQDNWRLQMYMLRAYYDATVARRHALESQAVTSVLQALSVAGIGSDPTAAIQTALASLQTQANSIASDPALQALNAGVWRFAAAINSSITSFVVADQQPELSLSTLNATITDLPWLSNALNVAAALSTPAAKAAALRALLATGAPAPGGYYDRLGSVSWHDHPHLVRGAGVLVDPSFYYTSLQGADTKTDALPASQVGRMATRSYSLSFFDAPLQLRYSRVPVAGLAGYNVSVLLWSPSSGKSPVARLVANGQVMVDYAPAPQPMTPVEFFVPIASIAAANQNLELSCNQPPGLSGSGRGCYISEVYVSPWVAA